MIALRFGCGHLEEGYRSITEEATRLAGKPEDIVRRSVVLHSLYEDSGQNYTFGELTAHAGFWFKFLFLYHESRVAKSIGMAAKLFPAAEKKWKQKIRTLCETLQNGNRIIFIDTLTHYFFTRMFGKEPCASKFISPELLGEYNKLHDATQAGVQFSEDEKRQLFHRCVEREQRLVDPVIKAAYTVFDIPVFRHIAVNPIVHMRFIPKYRSVFYRDFTNIDERLKKGKKVYEIALSKGWSHVSKTLKRYKECPKDLDQQAARYQQEFVRMTSGIEKAIQPLVSPCQTTGKN